MGDIRLEKEKKIDKLGTILDSFIIFKKNFGGKRFLNKKPKKIVLYKLDAMGDSVISLSMIKALKKNTEAEIIVVCSKNNLQIFENQEYVDKIYVLDRENFNMKRLLYFFKKIRSEKIDISIDTGQTINLSAIISHFTTNFSIGFKKPKKSIRDKVYDISFEIDYNKHMFYNYMNLVSLFGIKNQKPFLVKQEFSEENLNKINKALGRKKKLIGIHAFSYIKAKQWPLERFSKIIDFLMKKNYSIVLVGGKGEIKDSEKLIKLVGKKNKKKIINLTGKLDLNELSALMTRLKMFLANDGGPMHIAASMDIPTIGLFGYETPKRYAPLNRKSISIYNVKNHDKCKKKFLIEWPKCRNPKHINSISFKQVKEKINQILK